MPQLKNHFPKLCRHHKGQAFVKIDGRQIWLGRHGDPLTRERYDRLIAEWLSNGRRLPIEEIAEPDSPTTVSMLLTEYWRYSTEYYGEGSTSLCYIRSVMRVLRKLYGSTPALEFGPKKLQVVRDEFIRQDLARGTVNKYVDIARHIFKHAVAQELIPAHIHDRLMKVARLRSGKSQAKESRKVLPVDRSMVRQVRPYLSRQVRALIDLQLLSGARGGELLGLRPIDLDTSGKVWVLTLEQHKKAHEGKSRTLFFGPRAQRVLQLFMKPGRPLDAPLFSPREANAESKVRNGACGRRANQKQSPSHTDRTIGDQYTKDSYGRAIRRACNKAFPAPDQLSGAERKQWRRDRSWSPHQLRHSAATSIRREFGIEVARIILGHASVDMTAVYAEQDLTKAVQVMRQIG